jgi:hypothetical protein
MEPSTLRDVQLHQLYDIRQYGPNRFGCRRCGSPGRSLVHEIAGQRPGECVRAVVIRRRSRDQSMRRRQADGWAIIARLIRDR